MGEELNMAGKPRSQLEQYGRLTDLHGEEYIIPDYTIKDIYDAIPVECFKRNVIKSLSYVFQDLFLIGLNFYLFHTYLTADNVPYVLVRVITPLLLVQLHGSGCKMPQKGFTITKAQGKDETRRSDLGSDSLCC